MTSKAAISAVASLRLQMTYAHVSTLILDEKNPRTHSQKQKLKLRKKMAKEGFLNAAMIDETNKVLCGNLRVICARELGIEWIPVVEISHLGEAEKRAYVISDNRIAEEAGWSKALLRDELKGLIDLGFDVELTGFDTIELDRLLRFDGSDEKTAPAAVPEDNVQLPDERAVPVCRLGDLWSIGDHRLYVGDCRDGASLEALLADERAQLIVTDPPYGCRIANNVSGLGKVKHENFVLGAGEQSLPEFAATVLRPAFKQMALHAQSGAIAFVFTDWRCAYHLIDAAQGVFHEMKNMIVWAKTNASLGAFYRSAHELIYAYKVSPGVHINNFGLGGGGRHRTNVWIAPGANTFRAGRMQDLEDHSTVKPKHMLAEAILDCSKPGGIVLDCFAGSGSTLVAAQMTGRRGYGIELDPKYADVILRRVSEEAGVPPMLGDRTFDAVAIERRADEMEADNG